MSMYGDEPSESEKRTLESAEGSAQKEIRDVPGISSGRQSKVTVLEFRFDERRELVVWKRMAAYKGLSREEAQKHHAALRPYRRSLRSFGWNIPKLFHTHLDQTDDEWQIWSYEQYIAGGDADHLVAKKGVPNYRKWFILRTAIETLAEYPPDAVHRRKIAGEVLTALPHGLDLKLANIVASETQVWFVDLFGTKLIEGDGWSLYSPKIDTLSEEALLAVCATREGAILRFVRLAEASWLRSGSISKEIFRTNIEDVFEQSGLDSVEMGFIMGEIKAGYPWLDGIYSEQEV